MSEHDQGHQQRTGAGEAQEPPAGLVAGLGPAGGDDAADDVEPASEADPTSEADPASEGEPTGAPDEQPASTGDGRVDAAVSRLAELDGSPVHEHAAVVEAVHRTLQDTLAEDED